MEGDGPGRDPALRGDLLVGQAAPHQLRDLKLHRGEGGQRGRIAFAGRLAGGDGRLTTEGDPAFDAAVAAAYSLITANAYDPAGRDGHFAWCVTALNRADITRALLG